MSSTLCLSGLYHHYNDNDNDNNNNNGKSYFYGIDRTDDTKYSFDNKKHGIPDKYGSSDYN